MLQLRYLKHFRRFYSSEVAKFNHSEQLKPSQVVVEIEAETVRYSHFQPNLPDFGKEIVGHVTNVGQDSEFSVGDRIFAQISGRTLTDQPIVLHHFNDKVLKLPESLETEFGLASVGNYALSYLGLKRLALEKQGNLILLHGQHRSLSAALSDLAENLFECEITGINQDPTIRERFVESGCHGALDWNEEGFVNGVIDKTFGQGVDFVIDTVGGNALETLMECVKPNGHVLLLDQSSGILPKINTQTVIQRNLVISALSLTKHNPAEVRDALKMAIQILASGMPKGVNSIIVKSKEEAKDVLHNDRFGQVILRN